MQELTSGQIEELRRALLALRAELEQVLALSADGARPVDLDQPIGRVSRIDAIAQQKMAQANRRAYEARKSRVAAALDLIERGDYGLCAECEEPIGFRRLKANPETRFCLDCQRARE